MNQFYSLNALANKAIMAGIFGIFLFGGLTYYVFTKIETPLAQSDIKLVEGILKQVEEVHVSKGSGTLQIWIKSIETPFRSDGAYPNYFDKNSISKLTPGTKVIVGIHKDDKEASSYDYSMSQKFNKIVTLTVGRTQAISLKSYNEYQKKNIGLGKVVAPILLIVSLLSIPLGFLSKRINPENKITDTPWTNRDN